MSAELLLQQVVGFDSDVLSAGTWTFGPAPGGLIAPIKYIEAIDASVTVSGVKETLDGAIIDPLLNWLSAAIAITPAIGVMAFHKEIMQFTCSGIVKVWYSSGRTSVMQLVGIYLSDDSGNTLTNDAGVEILF